MLSNRGVWPAWLWMFVLALLLGWIPFIGPAIAGFVGGLQAGDTRSALIAALIPSVIVAGCSSSSARWSAFPSWPRSSARAWW